METPASESQLTAGPVQRRALLRQLMRERAEQGHSCDACSGICCTFVANSMRISPVEALDLKRHLQSEGRWTPDLLDHLRDIVSRYRLDAETGDGRRVLRKTYTCPFHTPGPRGCSIHPDHKPYGCLAFNPRQPGITQGGNCASARDALQQREDAFPEENAENQRLRQLHHLTQDTAPIPVALLNLR